VLTFDLLSPNVGIEYALQALPDSIREYPSRVYIVPVRTHPNPLRDEGEACRLSLENRRPFHGGVSPHGEAGPVSAN
jgi:hypothetical protein